MTKKTKKVKGWTRVLVGNSTVLIDRDILRLVKKHYYLSLAGRGYVKCQPKGWKNRTKPGVYLHRFVMDFNKEDKNLVVDHINRNILDNRRSNLRIVDRIQNRLNTNQKIKNYWQDPKRRQWIVEITRYGREKGGRFVKIFKKEEDARRFAKSLLKKLPVTKKRK